MSKTKLLYSGARIGLSPEPLVNMSELLNFFGSRFAGLVLPPTAVTITALRDAANEIESAVRVRNGLPTDTSTADRYQNPFNADEVRAYATTLRALISALDREIVDAALIGEGQADLLDPEGQKTDRFGKFLDSGVRVPFKLGGLRSRSLAVLDAFKNELLSGAEHESSPLRSGPGAVNTGETLAEIVAETADTTSTGVGASVGTGEPVPTGPFKSAFSNSQINTESARYRLAAGYSVTYVGGDAGAKVKPLSEEELRLVMGDVCVCKPGFKVDDSCFELRNDRRDLSEGRIVGFRVFGHYIHAAFGAIESGVSIVDAVRETLPNGSRLVVYHVSGDAHEVHNSSPIRSEPGAGYTCSSASTVSENTNAGAVTPSAPAFPRFVAIGGFVYDRELNRSCTVASAQVSKYLAHVLNQGIIDPSEFTWVDLQ